MNYGKLLTPVVGKLDKAEEGVGGNPVGGQEHSVNLDPGDLSDTAIPTRLHTTAVIRPPKIYTAEDCQVWIQSEKIHISLKTMEALESSKVWWAWWWGHPVDTGG